MEAHSRGVRVQIYLGESEQAGKVPRYQALLEFLRKEGAAGATVVRGVAGFGAGSRIHTAAIIRLSLDLPIVLVWIDAPGRVERLLPEVRRLAGDGIITVEEVGIAAYGGRKLEQLRFDLDVRDVMTRPVVSIGQDASLGEAVERLVGRHFRSLPVIDDDDRLVGVISNGDLVGRGGLPVRLELLNGMLHEARQRIIGELPDGTLVRDVMTRDVAVARAGETVATATRRMSERRLKRLPVVDADGRLLGILSRADILRAVAETFPRAEEHPDHPGARTAGELMRTDAPVVDADANLSTLLDVVVSTRLNRAIVVDGERHVLGIVTDVDVLSSIDPGTTSGLARTLMRLGGSPTSNVTAGQLIRAAAITVTAETLLADAAQVMTAHRRKVLPVVDDEGRLLGVLDRADLLHASSTVLEHLAREAVLDDEE
ncbi:MAG TPA: DUF190 domain-containing protein [Candidatus Saccharimonadales bacterium]|nr:DUF190 domain-containing protein [Candidatus Saccharimonadales bacterium]